MKTRNLGVIGTTWKRTCASTALYKHENSTNNLSCVVEGHRSKVYNISQRAYGMGRLAAQVGFEVRHFKKKQESQPFDKADAVIEEST